MSQHTLSSRSVHFAECDTQLMLHKEDIMRAAIRRMPRFPQYVTVMWCMTIVVAGIALGIRPADSAPSMAIVANFTANSVSLIDPITNAVTDINVGNQPRSLAITPDGTRAYVTNAVDHTISVIDLLATPIPTVTDTIQLPLGSFPQAIAIVPDGTRAYVVNAHAHNVTEIDTVNNVVVGAPISIAGAYRIAITPDGSRAYVTCSTANYVVAINTTDNTVSAPIGVGTAPQGIAITPDGKRVYVVNVSSFDVSVINTASNTLAGSPILVEDDPQEVVITPDGKYAYVVNTTSNSVSVINTLTNMVVRSIAVGVGPNALAVKPDGSKVYVTNFHSNDVWVIDVPCSVSNTPCSSVTIDLPAGSNPYNMAITPPRPFSAITAQYLVTLDPSTGNHTYKVTVPFTLGTGNDGINPLTESVFFQVGTRFATFPVGSFHLDTLGRFKATRIIDNVLVTVLITPLGGDQYKAVLSSSSNPETVKFKLVIGNDGGNLLP